MKNLKELSVTIKSSEKLIKKLADTPVFKMSVKRLMEIQFNGG